MFTVKLLNKARPALNPTLVRKGDIRIFWGSGRRNMKTFSMLTVILAMICELCCIRYNKHIIYCMARQNAKLLLLDSTCIQLQGCQLSCGSRPRLLERKFERVTEARRSSTILGQPSSIEDDDFGVSPGTII